MILSISVTVAPEATGSRVKPVNFFWLNEVSIKYPAIQQPAASFA